MALILFSGCSMDQLGQRVYVGKVDQYVEFYPNSWGSKEKCMLIIDGQKEILETINCDNIKEGDLLFRDNITPYFYYRFENNKRLVSVMSE